MIRKCIGNDEGVKFSLENIDHVARLDRDTKHIDAVIGSNIFPSYPVFIVSTFNIIESIKSHDMTKTSYGHCYHAMITLQLSRIEVRANDMDKYFNLLTELSYFVFNKGIKFISENELDDFLKDYENKYIFKKQNFQNLINSNILTENDQGYSFQYIYIYYYFIAKYIADNIDDINIKKQVNEIMLTLHKKESSNIIVFITHHTKDKNLIDNILLHTISVFKNFTEATLDNEEMKFIGDSVFKLEKLAIASENHNPEKTREKELKEKDRVSSVADSMKNEVENEEDNLILVNIRKSAKSLEIIGQIMRNQYGTFEKDRLHELFLAGQNVGLRLLKSFIKIMDDVDLLDNSIQERLSYLAKKQKKELSKEEIKRISGQFITRFSYGIIFGWMHKIVDSLGYDQLIGIADNVNQRTNTTASKLINFSIHAWHKKNIDSKKLELLYNDSKKDKNQTAIYLLKHIVSRHIYMHKIDFRDKQKISALLDFDVKKQMIIQKKIK